MAPESAHIPLLHVDLRDGAALDRAERLMAGGLQQALEARGVHLQAPLRVHLKGLTAAVKVHPALLSHVAAAVMVVLQGLAGWITPTGPRVVNAYS